MIDLKCTKCGKAIGRDDVNVAQDIAYCRSCNAVTKLSEMVDSGQALGGVDLSRPPARCWQRSDGMGTMIYVSHRSIGKAAGALIGAVFWNGIVSVFALFALSSTLRHMGVGIPDWFPVPNRNGEVMGMGMTIFLWLFLTPFIGIGLLIFGAFLSCLVGHTEVRVRPGDGVLRRAIGPFGWSRRFDPGAIQKVRIAERYPRYRSDDSMSGKEIVMEMMDGKEIKFGMGFDPEARRFVAAAIVRALKR
jgi:hypothetical protein